MTSPYDTTNNDELTAKALDAAKHIATVSAHGKSVHTRANGRFGCSPFAELVNACFPLAMRMTFTLAMRDVYEERRRQVITEGWTPEHDDHPIGFRDSAILRRDRIMERLYRRFHGAERYLPTIKQPPTVLQRSAQPLALY